MDLYCWAGVAILLIIGGIALMCLWSKSNSHGDELRWLKEENETRRASCRENHTRVVSLELSKADETEVAAVRSQISTVDESVGILEKQFSEAQELAECTRKDAEELWVKARDAERRIDAHEKRLNDQMSHILNDEKKLAVLGARVDGQDAVTLVALEAFDVVAEVYKAALAAGTFTVVDEQVSSRGRKPRGKGKRVA